MRKDVKFGLTIGAFLVVTLVVYIVVLTRGDKSSQEVKLVTTYDGGGSEPPAQQSPTDPALRNHDVTPPAHTGGGTADVTTPAPVPSHPDITPAPTTEPSVAVSHQTDWDAALTRGPDALLLSAPADRTVTPSAGGPTDPANHVVVSDGHPLIDSPAGARVDVGPIHPLVMDVSPVPSPTITPTPAPAPATQPTGVAASGPRTHKIASGETLSTISKSIYGNAKYWDKILAANPGLDPKHLKIGQTLVIPDLNSAAAPTAAVDHGADLPALNETTAGESAPVDPTTSYKVVQNDSLEKIAIKLYGKAAMKDKIYETNKALIGPDEDVLKIGWVLKLPTPPTAVASSSR